MKSYSLEKRKKESDTSVYTIDPQFISWEYRKGEIVESGCVEKTIDFPTLR